VDVPYLSRYVEAAGQCPIIAAIAAIAWSTCSSLFATLGPKRTYSVAYGVTLATMRRSSR
jgi:hypothetical protein